MAKIRKKPRYIDMEKCTGCGECFSNCPVELPNEFDMGQGMRKAIYVPFPQAVPLKSTIDKRGMHFRFRRYVGGFVIDLVKMYVLERISMILWVLHILNGLLEI